MLLLLVVIDETVFVKAPDRNFNDLLSVGQNNVFLGNKVGQVAFDDFTDFMLMTYLILVAFAVQRPVFTRYDKRQSVFILHGQSPPKCSLDSVAVFSAVVIHYIREKERYVSNESGFVMKKTLNLKMNQASVSKWCSLST